MVHLPGAEPGSSGTAKARPPRPSSGSVARLYSTPSGRLTTRVSGRPVRATPFGVAQERGREHRLARAIDAALGVEEGVEAGGRVAAADAAVGEIEGVLQRG